MKNVIIIGCGASGLLAGILLAQNDFSVLILEKNEQPGKKLAATGNGRCNFTNKYSDMSCYYGEDKNTIQTVLNQFTPEDTIHLFKSLGILAREKDGYCYPYSNQASCVVQILRSQCEKLGVVVHFGEMVTKIEKSFYVTTNQNCYEANNILLCTGGLAAEKLGGSEYGYQLAKSLGHSIVALHPGLTGLTCRENFVKLGGVRAYGTVSLFIDGRFSSSESGEIQFVKDGISGIPIFQMSRMISTYKAKSKEITLQIDFVPEMTEDELYEFLMKYDLRSILPKQLLGTVIARMDGKDTKKLAFNVKHFTVDVTGTFGWNRAQITAGGIPLREINPKTLESNLCPGVYFAGEILDCDGKCGGYNLQWAWASTFVACNGLISSSL